MRPGSSRESLHTDTESTSKQKEHAWRPAPVERLDNASSQETYTLFRPGDVFTHARSTELRRLEPDMEGLRHGDIYEALVMPWQINRKDVNQPHGSEWDPSLACDFWVSTDVGKISFSDADARHGQYHKAIGSEWQHYADVLEAPGNVGGFHACCVDTGQPDARWTLVAKLADFGIVLGRDAGVRVEFAALVRNDSESVVASTGVHDECRALFLVDEVTLPSGKLVLGDPTDIPEAGENGSLVPSGMGAGWYPVFVSKNAKQEICRITVVFHQSRAAKMFKEFPPAVIL